jgi:heptosyltransferase-2
VQTSYLGDVILTTPLLCELADRGPVDVITTPAGGAILANHPAVRAVIPYDKRGDRRGLTGLWKTGRHLRGRYHTAFLAQGSMRSATLAMLAGCRARVGFDTSAGRSLYTRCVQYRPDRHHAERLWLLSASADSADPPTRARTPSLYPGPLDIEAVDRLLTDAGYGGGPLIAIAPGSAWATKRWPYYAALARQLLGRWQVAVVGGHDDEGRAAEILTAAGRARRGVIDATGRLSPLATAALLQRCVALVSNDSAPQHLASAVGTPTVTIYGPTVPEFGFGPLAPRHAIAGLSALDCRPCDRHGPRRCPLQHWRCMRDLHVQEIEQLVARVTSPPHFS